MTYAEKLLDPRWQQKRLEVFERDNWSCVVCGRRDKELQVHHGYYAYGLEPWDYALDTLHTICHECHELATRQLKRLKFDLGCINPRFYPAVMEQLFHAEAYIEDIIPIKRP